MRPSIPTTMRPITITITFQPGSVFQLERLVGILQAIGLLAQRWAEGHQTNSIDVDITGIDE